MRMMLKVQIPVEAGNRGIKEGILPRVIEATVADIRPEASYFLAEEGKRTGMMIFDLKSPSDIPRIAERFFRDLNASVEIVPVMNAEDLKTGLNKLA